EGLLLLEAEDHRTNRICRSGRHRRAVRASAPRTHIAAFPPGIRMRRHLARPHEQGEQKVATSVNNPVPAGFDALPALDFRDPNFTVEGNRILAELRAKGPVCRVEPLGAL